MSDFIEKIRTLFLDFLFPQKSPVDLSPELLAQELKKPEDIDDDIVVLFDYSETLSKKLIWELKYKNNDKSAAILAELLHAQILHCLTDWQMFENFTKPLLIPVPMSAEKLEKRGYNQTEILVRKIVELDQGKNLSSAFHVVIKTKDTPDQSSLKKKERLKNLKDCFKVKDRETIKGRNILIIDDVVTTGATIKEVKRMLQKNGARKVKAVAVAH